MADQFKDFAKKMPKGGPPGIGGGAVVAIAGLAGAVYALQQSMYTGKFLYIYFKDFSLHQSSSLLHE